MSNEDMMKEYEKMMKDGNVPGTSFDGRFVIFTTFNDSKYETHTYCNIANIKK